MRALGAETITAWVGPHICGRCYEVPAGLRDQVCAAVPQAWGETSWGTPSVDVGAGVRAQLAAEEVAMVAVDRCTREDPDLYSHRRDGATTGRFAGLVRVAP
jgi:copper oxidase (laccase) domain-containing protein